MLIMNKLFCLITTMLIVISCKNTNETMNSNSESNIKTEQTKAKKITLKINGMTCAIGCAKTIENKLNELDGVLKAKVDFDSKLATIEYDSSIHSKQSLIKIIENVADGKTYKVK
ncbi:hypothetical protein BWK58_03020 [Flavobacterium columnare]|nr:hypothetical protein BWK58_03020 [Flavobacterium columnare]